MFANINKILLFPKIGPRKKNTIYITNCKKWFTMFDKILRNIGD